MDHQVVVSAALQMQIGFPRQESGHWQRQLMMKHGSPVTERAEHKAEWMMPVVEFVQADRTE